MSVLRPPANAAVRYLKNDLLSRKKVDDIPINQMNFALLSLILLHLCQVSLCLGGWQLNVSSGTLIEVVSRFSLTHISLSSKVEIWVSVKID